MRFQVPQYIEVEDKIFGPLTFKQFIYLLGGLGAAFISFRFLGFPGLLLGVPLLFFGIALAFYKHNGKPFIFLVEAAIRYSIGRKLYLWRRVEKPLQAAPGGAKSDDSLLFVPKVSQDKLKDMSWGIDTKEHMQGGARDTIKSTPK